MHWTPVTRTALPLALKRVSLCLGLFLVAVLSVQAQLVDGIAAIVNDKVITFSEVKKKVDPVERIMRETFEGQELVDRIKQARLNALKSLIERDLIIQDFKTRGAFVPENVVEDRIQDVINGQFDGDRSAFIKTLLANGISLAQYREQIEDQIIVQAMRQQNVSAAVIVSPFRIEQYYQENIREFVQEQQIDVSIIYLRKSVFKETRTLDDGSTEEYDPQSEVMKELLYKLDTGSNFSELARSYSEGPKRADGGNMGWVTRQTLRDELRDAAFELKPGQHSRVITTEDGYYVLRVEEYQKEKVEPMSDVRAKIERTLIQEERDRLAREWIDTLRATAFIKMF